MPDFDQILIRAYEALNASRRVSTEDITCDPDHRTPFLDFVHDHLPDASEATILRRLSCLRKRSLLPRLHRRTPAHN
jgi:hypothetical protein